MMVLSKQPPGIKHCNIFNIPFIGHIFPALSLHEKKGIFQPATIDYKRIVANWYGFKRGDKHGRSKSQIPKPCPTTCSTEIIPFREINHLKCVNAKIQLFDQQILQMDDSFMNSKMFLKPFFVVHCLFNSSRLFLFKP